MLRTSNGAHISVGGIYPSFSYGELMELCPFIDSVSIGEVEEAIVDMTRYLVEGNSLNEVRGIVP